MSYTPIVIVFNRSAELAVKYEAVGTAPYASKDCVETIRSLAGKPIRRILDCITDAESAAIFNSAMARTGGTYACLEECPDAWRTPCAVKAKEVMGFQILSVDLSLRASTYTTPGDKKLIEIGMQWADEMQSLMKSGRIKPHPLHELQNGLEAIIEGLEMLRKGEVRGQKLVVRIPQD